MLSITRNFRSCLLGLPLMVFHIDAVVATPSDASPDRTIARVEEAARTQLAQQAGRGGLLDPQFDVTVVRNAQPLPACSVPVNIDSIDTRQPSRMRFEVRCPGEGWRREFIVRAQVSARVLVAASDIPAGQALTEADVMLERRALQATPDTVSEPREIVGMSARRALRAGDSVRKSALVAPILVKRGDAVRILASRGEIEVSVAGVALEGGANGTVISVRNASSNNVIRARITASGTVEPIDIPASMPAHSPN
jgi:flagellar basal body P-ring formation protein FlgA